MLTIRKKLAPHWWRMGEDTDAAEFYIRPFTSLEELDFMNEIRAEGGRITVSGRGISVALPCVSDWRNVAEEGQPIKFDRAKLDSLDTKILTAIAAEIFRISRLSEDERKNSPSPSTSN